MHVPGRGQAGLPSLHTTHSSVSFPSPDESCHPLILSPFPLVAHSDSVAVASEHCVSVWFWVFQRVQVCVTERPGTFIRDKKMMSPDKCAFDVDGGLTAVARVRIQPGPFAACLPLSLAAFHVALHWRTVLTVDRHTRSYWQTGFSIFPPASCSCMSFNPETRRLSVGLDTGAVTVSRHLSGLVTP